MHYIKDIFNKESTKHAHEKFVRYSKGNFVGPILNIKITKNNLKLNSSFHLSDEILIIMGDYLGDREVHVKGTLAWNKDLAPDLEKSGIKYLKAVKSRGIFNYKLDNDIVLKRFVEDLGKYHVLLSFKEDDLKLTSKPKFPKPNKEISGDFCKTIWPIELKEKILSDFAFDVEDLSGIKDIEISHDIIIEDIVFPKNSDNLPFEEIRKLAKRKGKLVRRIKTNKDDSTLVTKEINFEI